MRKSLGISIALAASLALLPLAGCGQAKPDTATSDGSDSAASSSSEESEVYGYKLTEPFTYQGVTILGDPSWVAGMTSESNGYAIGGFDGDSQDYTSFISMRTFLHGQAATLDGAFKAGWPITKDKRIEASQTDSWTKDGIEYREGAVVKDAIRLYVLSGSDAETGKGFLITANFDSDHWTDDQGEKLFDAVAHTVEYDPSETDVDYENDLADDSSDDASSSQETSTYEDGMYKVGTDMPAGEYRLTADSGTTGYWEVTGSSAADADIVDNDNFSGSTYVTVSDGQYLKLEDCVAEPA